MLCIPKKEGTLCTVTDQWEQNAKTVKDVTPMPDQDNIQNSVACAKYWMKIDIADAYEQIHVEPANIWKMAFVMIYGTYASNTILMGDCNTISTFQRFMTDIFQDHIGIFLYVYLDDIFVYSDTIQDHQQHIHTVIKCLQSKGISLNPKKCDFYGESIDCLGHIMDKDGIHPETDKMAKIREWHTPQSYNDIERFLGLIQYLQHFMPNVSAYTAPLSGMTRNHHTFGWRPIHQKCFDMIKTLACQTPILRPIDIQSPDTIWVICNASTSRVGALYGQGPD
jgi:Reverse transcriptase (RNA-dependent DNA polymerase)